MDLDKLTLIKPRATVGDTSWFQQDRFGMFIHWGLYSLAARHEWVKRYECMTNERYERYFKHFDPDLYDPEVWAKAASDAGMKYFVITTKHHEGFCLWDSALTDYKVTNTPYGKDLIGPMIDAFRAQNMKVGLYHSLLDWHHPEYTTDCWHPMENKEEYAALDEKRDLNKYIDYLHAQTEELLTKYGKIDILWYDFTVKGDRNPKGRNEWRSDELVEKIRKIQPGIILNDRLEIVPDVQTPEQTMPRSWVEIDGQPVVWEGCHTFSGAWGYHREEYEWKSVEQLLIMLIDTVSKGGNFILNVGPTGRGEFDERALDRLQGIGKWMKYHKRSIYGCTQAPLEFETPRDTIMTYNPEKHTLYLHMTTYRFDTIKLTGELAQHVEYAQFLHDASEVRFGMNKEKTELNLRVPVIKPNVTIPVIEIFLK